MPDKPTRDHRSIPDKAEDWAVEANVVDVMRLRDRLDLILKCKGYNQSPKLGRPHKAKDQPLLEAVK